MFENSSFEQLGPDPLGLLGNTVMRMELHCYENGINNWNELFFF